MNLIWGVLALLLSLGCGVRSSGDQAQARPGLTEVWLKDEPGSQGLDQKLVGISGCPPPDDYLSLSNHVASLDEFKPTLVDPAYSWWKRGERWALERLWHRWPDDLLGASEQLPDFFSGDELGEAISSARRLVSLGPLRLDSGLSETYRLIAQKKLPEALERLIQAGLERSHWPLASWLAIESGEREKALEYLLLNEEPNAKQRQLMFELALETANYTEATNQASRLAQLSPLLKKSAYWLNNMSWALLGQAERLDATAPDEAQTLKLQAVDYIEKALEQDRSSTVLHTAALVLASLGRYREASINAQLALALNPTNQDYRALSSELSRKQKDALNE